MTETQQRTIDDLRMFKGLPVPWVARWSEEARYNQRIGFKLIGDQHWQWPEINYERPVARDSDGVVWQNDGITRTGIPEFGQVNTHRQVTCMKKRRCQVCGSKITTDETLFLLAERETEIEIEDGEFITGTPPVCESCCDRALDLCPALKQANRLIVASSYEKYAVFGGLYVLDKETRQIRQLGLRDVPYDSKQLRSVLGKQLIVKATVKE